MRFIFCSTSTSPSFTPFSKTNEMEEINQLNEMNNTNDIHMIDDDQHNINETIQDNNNINNNQIGDIIDSNDKNKEGENDRIDDNKTSKKHMEIINVDDEECETIDNNKMVKMIMVKMMEILKNMTKKQLIYLILSNLKIIIT